MLTRNDQPYLDAFNFSVDSVFNSVEVFKASSIPPVSNNFLLLQGPPFLLLDGTNFLLLGT